MTWLLALLLWQAIEFVCPMDPEIRAKGPGRCAKCGMALVAGIPRPVEYPVNLSITPRQAPPGRPLRLEFRVREPKTGAAVKKFEVVHERLFHLFVVSHDLEYFAHEHPEPQPDASFALSAKLPKPGIYRLLADYYPSGGTPQLTAKTIITQGFTLPLSRAIGIPKQDLAPKQGVTLELDPPEALAGLKTRLILRVPPPLDLEPYLGAWAHLLAASHDLIDTIHAHPSLAEGGPEIQFELIFPRAATYRLWIQIQRSAQVHTLAFTVRVRTLH
jgi:hypothetical protein